MWRAMKKGVVYVAVGVLFFLSAGQSAPVTDCPSLIEPVKIQGREQLLGKWTYLAESTNITGSNLLTKMLVGSAWGKMTAANESDVLHFLQSQNMFGHCFALKVNLRLENGTLSMEQPYSASVEMLKTGCPDCLVLHSKATFFGEAFFGLQLLTRRTNVSNDELQEFLKQVECLNLQPPSILGADKGLCPDESSSGESGVIDLTSFINDLDSEVFNVFDRILGNESVLMTFAKIMTSAFNN